jgi:hypothetical protein
MRKRPTIRDKKSENVPSRLYLVSQLQPARDFRILSPFDQRHEGYFLEAMRTSQLRVSSPTP